MDTFSSAYTHEIGLLVNVLQRTSIHTARCSDTASLSRPLFNVGLIIRQDGIICTRLAVNLQTVSVDRSKPRDIILTSGPYYFTCRTLVALSLLLFGVTVI